MRVVGVVESSIPANAPVAASVPEGAEEVVWER